MVSISCPLLSATYGPSSHPTQLRSPPDPGEAAPPALRHQIDNSTLSSTARTNSVHVFPEALTVDTARAVDPIHQVSEDVHVSNQPSDTNGLPPSPSMSSLFSDSKSDKSPITSLTLQFSSDENDGNSPVGGSSPVTFAMGDLDGEDWVVEFRDTDVSERSPLTFARIDFDLDDDDDLGTAYYRRVSWPMTVPVTNSVSANDDLGDDTLDATIPLKTLRRQSRSLDNFNLSDLPTANDTGATIGLFAKTNRDALPSPIQTQRDIGEQPNELDIQYILSAQCDGRSSKRSSAALSYVQLPPKMHDTGYLLALRRKLAGSTRPPSAGANDEDTFTRILEKWDSEYDARKDHWTIKRQDDVDTHDNLSTIRGPPFGYPRGSQHDTVGRSSRLRAKAKEKDKAVGFKGMTPGTEEIWKCGLMGMFKAERINYPGMLITALLQHLRSTNLPHS